MVNCGINSAASLGSATRALVNSMNLDAVADGFK